MPTRPRQKKVPNSWRRRNSTLKLFKKIKLFFFVFSCVFLTSIVLGGAYSLKIINAPFAVAISSPFNPSYKWDGEKSFNILFLGEDELGILKLDPAVKSYLFTKMSRNEFTTGDVSEVKSGIKKRYALSLDKYVVFRNSGKAVLKMLLGDFENLGRGEKSGGWGDFILGGKTNMGVLLRDINTDLTPKELLEISLFMKDISVKGETVFVPSETLQDVAKFDYYWRSNLLAKNYRDEGNTVMVVNGADIPGLAGWGTRVVENLGIAVADPTNAPYFFEKSQIVYKGNGKETVTLRGLSQAFEIDDVLYDESFEKYASFAQRADILVILGFDKKDTI